MDEEIMNETEELESSEEMEDTTEETEEETVEEPSEEDQETEETQEEKPVQSPEENHAYAEMRRKAEAAANTKMSKLDAEFAKEFGSYGVNSVSDYLERFRQDKVNQIRSNVEAGKQVSKVDLDYAISNSPEMQKLRQVVDEYQAEVNEKVSQQRLAQIHQLDPTVNSWNDIASMDEDRTFHDLVLEKGVDEVTAYKAVFFDRLVSGKQQAAQQAAINAARGKTHLAAPKARVAAPNALSDEDYASDWAPMGFTRKEAEKMHRKYHK